MSHFKETMKGYNVSGLAPAELIEAFKCFHPVFDYVEEHEKDAYWKAMRAFHEKVKGEHFDEMYAKYQVSVMYHTKENGSTCRGEIYNIDFAKDIYERHVRHINREFNHWDVYVAINAQYHDYIKLYKSWFSNVEKEMLDEKIISSAISFWFKDEDAGTGKVWNYFEDMN